MARANQRSAMRRAIALVGRYLRILLYAVLGGVLVLLVVGVRLLNARPDLRVWHVAELDAEFTDESPVEDFAGYLALEERLFEQTRRRVASELRTADRTNLNRFHAGSLSDPARWPRDWNRSFELTVDSPRAAVLLLHGMSDSPYSLRVLGRALHERGAHVLGLRLPGHGTAPSGLVSVRWQDMAAASELALRHLRQQVDGAPLFVIGYSNGGALAVRHAIAALEDPALTPVDGLVLISPSIGVTALAAFAVWQARLGVLLGLPKLAWSSILPEYDPFKYNSFAVNAGDQVHRLTGAISAGLGRLARAGRLDALPPVLAFQSVTDATVSTRAVIDGLFLRLPPGGHQLVLFDLNTEAAAEDLLASDPKAPIRADLKDVVLPFDLLFVTNENQADQRLVLRHKRAGGTTLEEEPLDLEWPMGLFSLSHIALPFPEADPLYGGPGAAPSPGIQLGRAELRGERGVLLVSATDLLRLRWNPFYQLLEQRVIEALGLAGSGEAARPATPDG